MPVCSVGEGVLGLTEMNQHSAPEIDNQYFTCTFFVVVCPFATFHFFPNFFLIFFSKKKKKIAPGRGGWPSARGG